MQAIADDRRDERDDPLFQATVVWESLQSAAAIAGLTETARANQEEGAEEDPDA